MGLGLTNRGTGTHNTSATSFTLSPGGNCAAGSWAVLCVAADNSASGGSSNNITNVTDSIGNTWTQRRATVFDPGAANAGVQLSIWTTDQDVGPLQTGTVITVEFGAATVAKTWTLTEVTKAAGETISYVTGADDPGAATAAPTLTTVSIASGDAVIAAYGVEAGTTQTGTGDADTTNGSWTTAQYAEIGSTTSGSVIISQGKVVTATATQTYNPTLGISSDTVGAYIVLHATEAHSGSVTATGGGVAAVSAQKAATAGVTATGGGVASLALSAAHSGVATATGGGVATVASTSARSGSVTATAGGVAAVAPVAGRQASIGATAGGAATVDGIAGRAAAVSATGAGQATIASTSARAASIAGTGGGEASLSVRSARFGAALLSGGGVVAVLPTSARLGSVLATGGGVATVVGEGSGGGGEEHSGSVQATGGGVALLVAMSARLAAITATGGGSASIAASSARSGSVAATGGGVAVASGAPSAPPVDHGYATDFGALDSGDLLVSGVLRVVSHAEHAGFSRYAGRDDDEDDD